MREVVTLVTGGSHPATPVISDVRRLRLERNIRPRQRFFELPGFPPNTGRSPRTAREGGTSGSIGTDRISPAANEPGLPLRSGLAKFAEGF